MIHSKGRVGLLSYAWPTLVRHFWNVCHIWNKYHLIILYCGSATTDQIFLHVFYSIAGFIGPRCDTFCPSGYYGNNCTQTCDCENGASCSPTDGSCNCTAGWQGHTCNQACQRNTYGKGCSQSCACRNTAVPCDPVDGTCICLPGWHGDQCTIRCQQGKIGLNSSQEMCY